MPRRFAERAGSRLVDLDELELEVEKLVTGGEGLGRFEGIPIFVPRAAAGDRLRVQLVERRPDYGRAEIVEILRPGPGRREAPCPYFARCGGCDLQHLDDDVQLRAKAEAARETLERIGGVAMPAKVTVVPGRPFGYRLRTQLQVMETARGTEVGYFQRGSHELVAVDRCPILVDELSGLLPSLPALLRDRGLRRLDLAAGDDGVTAAPVVPGLPHGEVTMAIGGLVYAYDARSFFQTHRDLVGSLVAAAVGDAEGETAHDLYAGVGLFSLALARRYRRVVAVEGDRIAARHARNNARRNHAGRGALGVVEVVNRSVESWIGELPAGAERVVVDPPRSGLARPVRAALAEQRPRRLTYVSCDAATLARDLRALGSSYRLVELTLLDLFPQTGHLESVAQLELVEEATA